MSKLDEAKINLKSVLERLEKALDNALINTSPKNQEEVSILKSEVESLESGNKEFKLDIEDKKAEIAYLREENMKLQAKNGEAVRRVDSIIMEVKNYLTNHEEAQL